jgi:hypothetical protein
LSCSGRLPDAGPAFDTGCLPLRLWLAARSGAVHRMLSSTLIDA